ncbi:MAG TPA: hypothetical protein PK420_12915, partial [Rubrivivax sp.]|nr:hypothetical protein [Rubrivivax sp.]
MTRLTRRLFPLHLRFPLRLDACIAVMTLRHGMPVERWRGLALALQALLSQGLGQALLAGHHRLRRAGAGRGLRQAPPPPPLAQPAGRLRHQGALLPRRG